MRTYLKRLPLDLSLFYKAEELSKEQKEGYGTNSDALSDSKKTSDQDENPSGDAFLIFRTKQEYQKHIDAIIGKRLRDYRELRQKLALYEPAVTELLNEFEVDSPGELKGAIDDALIRSMKRDEQSSYCEPDDGDIKELAENASGKIDENTIKEAKEALCNEIRDELSKLHDNELYKAADIDELVSDQRFLCLLANGFSLRDAFDAVNVKKIVKAAVDKAVKATVDDIRARGLERPVESALTKCQGADVKRNIKALSNSEIDEINRRVAKGEKIIL